MKGMLVWAMLLLTACSIGRPVATATLRPTPDVPVVPAQAAAATRAPVASDAPVPATAEVPQYDGRWREVEPGLEVLLIRGRVGEHSELLVVLRVDPARQALRVRYAPDSPRLVHEWFNATGAAAVINAGYFLEDKRTASLLIVNGAVHGQTYKGFGGMFAVREGAATLQWLRRSAYRADAAITQAVQSVPMLVEDGAVVPGIPENGERNRRSFVAVDARGRVLLGVGQTAAWTLTELATYLAAEESLEVQAALNLDGGASSGLWVRGGFDPVLTNSLETVPSVITVGG